MADREETHQTDPERRPDGTFLPSHSVAVRGHEAVKRKRRLVRQLGLREIAATSEFRQYNDAANDWRAHQTADFRARHGEVTSSVATVLANAALQLAASRYYYDQSVCVETVDPRVELDLFVAQKKTSASFMRMATSFAESVNKSLRLAEDLASGKRGAEDDKEKPDWLEGGNDDE